MENESLIGILGDVLRLVARRKVRLQYFKPYVVRREAGRIIVAACHSSHVTASVLHGQTLEGNASWHVRRIGNQLYEITAEPWNTEFRK